jgi:hypothetical protein
MPAAGLGATLTRFPPRPRRSPVPARGPSQKALHRLEAEPALVKEPAQFPGQIQVEPVANSRMTRSASFSSA